jgi:ribonuclease P protein component
MAKTPSSDAVRRVATRFLRKTGPSKARFESIYQGGKRVSTAHLRLIADRGVGKVGIATAKKTGCHARRNWVKRRIRECIASLESRLRNDLDYIAIATPNVVEMDFGGLQSELGEAVIRMNERWAEELESS